MPKTLRTILLALLPIGYVELLWFINGKSISFHQSFAVILVSATVYSILEIVCSWKQSLQKRQLKQAIIIILILVGGLFFTQTGGLAGLEAYIAFSVLASAFLILSRSYTKDMPSWVRLIVVGSITALLFSATVMGYFQIIERFSEEEFYVAVQLFLLAGWWFLVWLVWSISIDIGDQQFRIKLGVLRFPLAIGLILFFVLGFLELLKAYQASFYPSQAPIYSNISIEQPFLCGTLSTAEASASSVDKETFQKIIEQTASNPDKTVPDLGMLALTTREAKWESAFHQGLLAEVRQGMYTGPAGSVKYGQYEAALRAYYYHAINEIQPNLFTQQEHQEVMAWFAAVNRRSLTVEWVDWMYAVAFGEWPKGPYLNQENGAGLLALLESYHYSDPALSRQNQEYLSEHQFGWNKLFHNTDDSISYQTLWINNALFQSIADGKLPQQQIKKSFEWLLLQALPDGGMVGYNPSLTNLAASAYLGAQMTGDGRLLWLSGRSVDYMKAHDFYVHAQPGIQQLNKEASIAPDIGSCLLYSNSGTPVRQGPLTPDKIVFRDGWQSTDRYLSLNLRFTGWHRYKATNDIISIYQEEPLIVEQLDSPASSWLPIGRSQFRDKRIPRENLNGLVIPKVGISQLVYWWTGFGSQWAQDPPFYVTVTDFSTGIDMDRSTTVLEWNGWKQKRTIYFVHDGPTVIVDDVNGPQGQTGGIVWHAIVPDHTPVFAENKVLLGTKGKVEMQLMPLQKGQTSYTAEKNGDQAGMQILFTSSQKSSVKLVTLFLSGVWRDAQIKQLDGILKINLPNRSITIPLPTGS